MQQLAMYYSYSITAACDCSEPLIGGCFRNVCCHFYLADRCVERCPRFSTTNVSSHECECYPGYEPKGTECVEIDECDPNPCQNGGNCTDLIDNFVCTCFPEFTDENCSVICTDLTCPTDTHTAGMFRSQGEFTSAGIGRSSLVPRPHPF